MTVYFIGAGPGAADLLTVRAARLIARCRTCLYAGSIVPTEVLASCPEGARVVNTARMPLGEILAEIRAAHGRGEDVARLHSGDPGLYSALDEQVRALDAEGIDWQIVPGVAAWSAAAAELGVELTVPHVSQSVVLTRVDGRSTPMPPGEDLASVCASGATAVIHLAAAQMDRVVAELTPVYGKDCPVAVVAFASRPEQQVVRDRLDRIADRVREAGITRTAVIVVGRVLDRTPVAGIDGAGGTVPTAADVRDTRSFLYSDDRPRDALGRTVCADPTAPGAPAAPTAPGTPPQILVLGGTSEGRELADLLHRAGIDVVTSLAGRVQRPRLPSGEVRIGGFGGPEGLAAWLREHSVSAVIDATHPFAERISRSATEATDEVEVPLLRLHRRAWEPVEGDQWIRVTSMAEAARVVRERFRRPLLTVGRQNLAAFAGDSRGSYLIRCVEPPEGPLPHRYLLVLDRGPFAVDSETTLMARHRIDVLVTKNSGGGATEPKLQAARDLRIPVVVVDRPPAPRAETVHTVEDAARWIVARFGSGAR